jgi:hypothetical protein
MLITSYDNHYYVNQKAMGLQLIVLGMLVVLISPPPYRVGVVGFGQMLVLASLDIPRVLIHPWLITQGRSEQILVE